MKQCRVKAAAGHITVWGVSEWTRIGPVAYRKQRLRGTRGIRGEVFEERVRGGEDGLVRLAAVALSHGAEQSLEGAGVRRASAAIRGPFGGGSEIAQGVANLAELAGGVQHPDGGGGARAQRPVRVGGGERPRCGDEGAQLTQTRR